MNYANQKALETRQREAIAYNLATIKEKNGYFLNFGTAFFSLATRFNAAVWPAYIVLNKGAKSSLENASTGTKTTEAKYDILVVKRPSETPNEDEAALFREQALSDVSSCIEEAYALCGADGQPTCSLAYVSGYYPWNRLGDQNIIVMQIEITVEYNTVLGDGTQKA